MHEFTIATGIVEAACEEVRVRGSECVIRSVTCRVGILRQVDEELLRQAFELAAEETPCAGARLVIEKAPVRLNCPRCGKRFDASDWEWSCPRCGEEATCVDGGGDELELRTMEVSIPEEEMVNSE